MKRKQRALLISAGAAVAVFVMLRSLKKRSVTLPAQNEKLPELSSQPIPEYLLRPQDEPGYKSPIREQIERNWDIWTPGGV